MNGATDQDQREDGFNLDLYLLARHGLSLPQHYCCPKRAPGPITYALIQMLEKIADQTDQARIITDTEVVNLVLNEPAVMDSDYRRGNYGPVLWASDGYYTADFGNNSLLTEYRPDLMHIHGQLAAA
eukprot:9617301-Heterocapsa_arctica.AAC.1